MNTSKPITQIETKIITVKPTHVAQKCPTCSGFGTVTSARKTCHGCAGKGYILIPAEVCHNKERREF